MKVKVKIAESLAGLADPDTKKLEEKYAKIKAELKARDKPPSEGQITRLIDELKVADRYAETPIGFRKDWSFKPGDEAMIEADLAKKWAEAGICTLLENARTAA